MKNFLMIMMSSLLLISCYTDKDAFRQMIKANDHYPEKVAEFTRTHYPCFDVKDSIVVHDTSYDFIEIQCPQDESHSKIDTIWLEKWRRPKIDKNKIGQLVAVPMTTKIVNTYIRDSSEVNLLEYRLKKCAEENQMIIKKNDGKADWIKWLLIILAISLLLNVILITKK